MEIIIGMAKINKNASSDGDGFEVAERPGGGLSVILAENAGSARSGQDAGYLAASKAAALITGGIRDAMLPRAIHDYLQAEKEGRIAVMLTVISMDTETQTVSFARNSVCPLFVRQEYGVDCHDETGSPLGIQKAVKPLVSHTHLAEGLLIATFSDGVMLAGRKQGRNLEMDGISTLLEKSRPEDAQYVAEDILSRALMLDGYQPYDNMTAICIGLSEKQSDSKIQRRTVNYPL